MILDSSAIVAMLLEEPGFEILDRKLIEAPVVGVGVPTLVETGIVLTARVGGSARGHLARFVMDCSAELIAFREAHLALALDAWQRFGKGRHPAQLNFGDCLTYAVARAADRPLLCTGRDFEHTDLLLA